MENPDLTLELSSEQMRTLVTRTLDHIIAHIESLPQQPAADSEDWTETARDLVEPLPEHGQSYPELLDLLFRQAK